MHILGSGREALLSFLRNLSPQILIFSFALVCFNGLKMGCCDPSTFKKSFMFFMFLLIFALSTWANCTVFIDNFLTSTYKIKRAERLLKLKKMTGLKLLSAKIKFSFKNARFVLFESLVVILIMEFSFVAVLVASAAAAANFIKLVNGN